MHQCDSGRRSGICRTVTLPFYKMSASSPPLPTQKPGLGHLHKRRPPRRRLEHVHAKSGRKALKGGKSKIDALLIEIGSCWDLVCQFLGLSASLSMSATSRLFLHNVNAHLSNRKQLSYQQEYLNSGTEEALLHVLRNGCWLKELDLSKCIHATDRLVRNIVCCCPQMEVVSVEDCPLLTPEAILSLGEIRSLKKLNVNLAFASTDRFQLIQNLAKNDNSLLDLKMDTCKVVDAGYNRFLVVDSSEPIMKRNINHCLAALSLAHPQLESLSISGSTDLEYKGIRALSMSTTYGKCLIKLDLSFCLMPCDCAASVCESLCLLQALEELNLHATFDVQDNANKPRTTNFFMEPESIEAISALSLLRVLDIRRLPVWDGGAAYARLFMNLNLLESFKSDWIPSTNTYKLLATESRPGLRTLELCWADTLQDRRRSRQVKAVAETAMVAISEGTTQTTLEHLSLGSGSGMSPIGVAACTTVCTALKTLRINEGHYITDDTFSEFSEGKGLIFLKIPGETRGFLLRIDALTENMLRSTFYLHSHVPVALRLQNESFVHVLKTGLHKPIKKNQEVEISPGCVGRLGIRLSNSMWTNFVLTPGASSLVIDFWRQHGAASRLTRLYLSKCRFLTDISVRAILSRSPNLQELSLVGLPNVTDDLWPDMRVDEPKRKEATIYSATGRVVKKVDAVKELTEYNGYILSVERHIDNVLRRKLRKLEICDCNITEKTVLKLAAHPLDALQTIILHDLELLPLAAVPLLCGACSRLRAIDFCRILCSDGSLEKIIKSCPTLSFIKLTSIKRQRPFLTGVGAARIAVSGKITHFIIDDADIRKCVENAAPHIITNEIGQSGQNQRGCIHVPLAMHSGKIPRARSTLIHSSESAVDDAELALVDALSDKADLSYKLEWKNDLRLLKMKNIKKVV